MKVYVVLKTYKADFADIFPHVASIQDTLQGAIEFIARACDTTIKDVEKELDDNNCYSVAQARYTIFKYVD